ncbi:MAG: hypothetical protein IID09_08560 [Candidatus Hydrogenedentes bacterium]|nr:hypothetical protein [Candidatus Hydrogenedentota bacterium]
MQLELPCLTAEGLRLQLELLTSSKLRLCITDNSSTMMNFKEGADGEAAELRVHHMFLSAAPEVVRALAEWISGRRGRKGARLLDHFIEAHQHLVRTRRGQVLGLMTQGARHDLQRLYEEVNAAHFEGQVDAPITWGRMPGGRRRRSIRLGSYTPEDHLIRIHPLLDQEFVPEYFVRYIVFHEMLHAYVGFETTPSGRRRVHTVRFYRLERQYPDYERAVAWHDEPRNLSKLLRAQPKSA